MLSCCFPLGLLGLFGQGTSAQTITYVQGNYATPQTPQNTVEVTFNAAQVAGDLNVVVVGWNDSTAVVSAVTDSNDNAYALAVGPTIQTGLLSQSIYYARNIASAAAGSNTVTVTFASAAYSPDIRVVEYSGADPNSPVDVTAASSGKSATSNSGLAVTTNATDLIFGANLVHTWTTRAGSGFIERLLTTPDGDIAEDKMVTAAGSYSATAPLGLSGKWVMQLVAFRTPSVGTPPSITPTALSCGTASMTGPGTDSCTVTLSAAAPSGGLSVTLSSNSATVTLPATVTVPASATSATITATVSSVATAQAVTLTATANGVSKTFALQLNADTPTLTVATSSSPSTYGGAVTFTATISSDPPGTVTFYDGGIVIGTGTINGSTATLTTSSLTAGSQTITANWPGNSNYGAVTSGAITQVVNQATPTITWGTPVAIVYGTALSGTQLDASSTVAGTFSYSPAAGAVLTAGSHVITATFTPTNSTDYATATSSVSITVSAATPAITWATPAAITYGTALSGTQLDASSTVAGSFSYSPTAGTVLAAGSHAITATFTPTDTTDYTTATATVTLTVNANATTPTITWVAPAAITYGTALSGTQLDASSTVAGTFAYSPIAGTVLTAGSQTLSVTFTPTDTTDYATATATVGLTVSAATPAITWAAPAAVLYGTALSGTQLDASSTVAGTFTYSPVAGTVLTAGSHTITATFAPTDSTDYKTATSTVSITVNAATPAITWAAPAAIAYGTAVSGTQLDASSTVAGTFAYSPIAGTVLKAGSQTLSVTFTPTDTNDYKAVTATVTLTVNAVTPAITWAAPAAITYGTALSGTQLDASSTVAGTFSYSPAPGTVLAAGSHAITATFTPTDTTDYTTASATVGLTVNTATPTVTWAPPAAILYGTALSGTQLDASSTTAGTFSYTPAAGTVLKAGSQTLSVSFTPTDTTDYTTASATVGLTVNTATPTVTWAPPAAILYGTALSGTQLDASSTVAGTFAYSPTAGTLLKAGSQTLTVTFTPTDTTDYTTATATVGLTVNTATPTITWAAPATILYGAALSGTQLDASSTVAGTFAYTPAAGTVLKAGSQTLSVSFTPTDTTDYKTATATVALTVNEGTPTITWAAPVAVTYGTALSGTQLDASSTISGTFVYSPAAGTVLAVGSQTLSVTFTPTDTTDYTTATATVTLTVNQATSTLSINATSVGFGDVVLNTAATQSVTLTSTGTAAVTVNSATVTGTGFTLSAPTFPATLTPGQTATLSVQFDPTTAGAATGSLTITSTSSSNGTAVIPLTGTGTAASYAVDLSWYAPGSSPDPVAGYNVYRSPSGSSTYQLLNSLVDTETTYVDSTVQDGLSYDYIVESVDALGNESVPTSPIVVTIP